MAVKVDYKFDTSRLERAISSSTPKSLELAGSFIADEMRERVPVKTGKLRDSIEFDVKDDDVSVGSNEDYAIYVEDNTGFMTSSLDENHDKILKIVAGELEEGLDEAE